MCLIIISPQGVDKFNANIEKAIRTSGLTNDDGAGYAYKLNGLVHVKKGFMEIDELVESLKTLSADIGHREYELMIHLRNGNVGEISQRMCHPFVCTEDVGLLESLEGEFSYPVIAHNGTFSVHGGLRYMSDTYVFVKDDLSRTYVQDMFMEDPEYFQLLYSKTLGASRLVMFHPSKDKPFVKIGKWFEDDGIFFSNQSYISTDFEDKGGVAARAVLPINSNKGKQLQIAHKGNIDLGIFDYNYSESKAHLKVDNHISKLDIVYDNYGEGYYKSHGLYIKEIPVLHNSSNNVMIVPSVHNYKELTAVFKSHYIPEYPGIKYQDKFSIVQMLNNASGTFALLVIEDNFDKRSNILVSLDNLLKYFIVVYKDSADSLYKAHLDLAKSYIATAANCKVLSKALKGKSNESTVNIQKYNLRKVPVKAIKIFLHALCVQLNLKVDNYIKKW